MVYGKCKLLFAFLNSDFAVCRIGLWGLKVQGNDVQWQMADQIRRADLNLGGNGGLRRARA